MTGSLIEKTSRNLGETSMIDDWTIFLIGIFVFAISLWVVLIWWALKNIKIFIRTKKITPQLFVSVILLLWFIFANLNSLLETGYSIKFALGLD